MRRTRSVLLNDSLLLLTAVIWGLAFVAQRRGMDFVGPFTYNAVRFALGSFSLVPFILVMRGKQQQRDGAPPGPPAASSSGPGARRISPISAGLLAGVILTIGASLQQVGLVYTTAGKAGFITGLYVVLVPLLGLAWRQRAGWSAWVGAALSVVGLFFLSFTASLTIERGDLLVLIGAIFWAAHVQVVGLLSPRTDPLRLSCVQFAVCSVLSAVGALLTEQPLWAAILSAAGPILYGGLLSVGVAYTLQVVAQRSAPPAHAAILLSLESVFAALGGWIVLGERLPMRGVAGCLIMFAGVLISQAPLLLSSLAAGRRRV
jgi:drug/metabolite transporter (DMT)-like permease